MKQIIVAVDFSESSINSLEHALTIAQKSKANLSMVWVNNATSAKALNVGDDTDLLSAVNKKFEELVASLQPRLKGAEVNFFIREGKVYKEVAELAKELKSDLIMTGTHGTSGYDPFWIGSNANKLISASPCPVITIRLGINVNRDLKTIVFPIDDTLQTRQKVPITTSIARFFDAEVHILGLYTSSVDQVMRQIDLYCDQVATHMKKEGVRLVMEKVEAGNLTKATIEYAQKVDANLIAIMTEQTKAAMNLWLGPYAQQMVNQSPIPVLSVHPKNLNLVTARF